MFVAKMYLVPYWIFVMWLDVVTFLHHTDKEVSAKANLESRRVRLELFFLYVQATRRCTVFRRDRDWFVRQQLSLRLLAVQYGAQLNALNMLRRN